LVLIKVCPHGSLAHSVQSCSLKDLRGFGRQESTRTIMPTSLIIAAAALIISAPAPLEMASKISLAPLMVTQTKLHMEKLLTIKAVRT
jgi:hypothetical protein